MISACGARRDLGVVVMTTPVAAPPSCPSRSERRASDAAPRGGCARTRVGRRASNYFESVGRARDGARDHGCRRARWPRISAVCGVESVGARRGADAEGCGAHGAGRAWWCGPWTRIVRGWSYAVHWTCTVGELVRTRAALCGRDVRRGGAGRAHSRASRARGGPEADPVRQDLFRWVSRLQKNKTFFALSRNETKLESAIYDVHVAI